MTRRLRYELSVDVDPAWLARGDANDLDVRVHRLTEAIENAISDAVTFKEGVVYGTVKVWVLTERDAE